MQDDGYYLVTYAAQLDKEIEKFIIDNIEPDTINKKNNLGQFYIQTCIEKLKFFPDKARAEIAIDILDTELEVYGATVLELCLN